MKIFARYNDDGTYIGFYPTTVWNEDDIPEGNKIELSEKEWNEALTGNYVVNNGVHTKFIPTQSEIDEGKLRVVRKKRDRLLLESDWTQIPNNPLTEEKQQEWAVYRQNLRDITDSKPYTFPEEPE